MFRGNPIYKKEVRTGMRTMRVTVLIIGVNAVLAVIAFIMFSNTINGITSMGALDYSGLTNLYTVMAYIEFGIIALIVPAITAGAIVGERERQTLEVMLASKVNTATIVFGKMLACAQIVIIMCVSSLPVLSIVFVYGGIRLGNLIMLLSTVLCAGIYFGSIGIFTSCICKRTTTAVMLSYISVVGIVFVTGGITYVVERLNLEGMSDSFLVDNVSHIMLLNPAATVVNLVGTQLETTNYFEVLLSGVTAQDSGEVFDNWTAYSIILQLMLSLVLLIASAWILNPLKFNLWRRFKKLNGENKS